MSSLSLPNITITSAAEVPAGAFTLPPGAQGAGPAAQASVYATLPAFCRVTAVARPSADSEIALEVWLPAANWNTRFQPVGNGLWGGSLNYQGLAAMLQRGYATASNDTGHRGPGASFAVGHPEKVVDFGYRAFHEMTLLAKGAIERFYERRPSLSLVDQCGGASRGALAEVNRHPDGFDIIAASGIDPETTRHSMGQLWVWQAAHKTRESVIPQEKLPLLHQAVLEACDGHDGIADGIIADPLSCKVDPGVLQCRAGDAADCLTAAQVETARTIYSPVTNPRTNDVLFGPLLPGSELGWASQAGPEPFGYGTDFFRYLVMKDPSWHPRTRPVDFDRDAALADAPQNLVVNVEPNVNGYFDRGGKLLIVGGWADVAIAPASNTNFYERVVGNAGARAERSVRLFMVPGMLHCPAAPNAANGHVVPTAEILEAWLRTGTPPESIVVSRRVNGAEERKMLVCRYPRVAQYIGPGDPKSPDNYACR
ncbi:MAG: tannase/feruloyl esterase family alpha/beta hydrolase [Acidobacteria bacterium]|nr:tannase/feruloyl esterase family alpha/beta hydrolase [Acidobacteriota bacterium]